jgi:hypothetical protein
MAGSVKTHAPVRAPRVPQASPNLRDLGIPVCQALEAVALSTLVAGAVFLVQWRYGFNWGDEGWLWYISQRTALGQVPIRDVFSYDPGRYYWSAAIFKILGRNGFYEQLAANYLFGAIGLAVSYFAMLRVGVSRSWRIAILVLLGVALGFPRHKIYEQALSLVAAAGISFILTSPDRPRRWFFYGIAAGLAAFVGRNSGLYFAIAALLAFAFLKIVGASPPAVRSLGGLLLGIAIGYSPILLTAIRFHGFASAFVDSVLLTPNWSWGLRIPFPWHSHASGLRGIDSWQVRAVSWLCLAVPVSYCLLTWCGFRAHSKGARTLATGASLAGAPYLHHAFYHADFFHIAQGVLPFVVGGGAFSQHLWTIGRRRWSLVCMCGLILIVLACWLPVEPLIQHLRAKANAPQLVDQIKISGRNFEIPAMQAQVMRTVEAEFRNCGSHDGGFLEAPFYPGVYAFLGTRAPVWDTWYLWPRSDAVQIKHIQALVENRTSLVLINRYASFDQQDWLQMGRTYPKLVDYILTHYERAGSALPAGFEIYFLPQRCRVGP